jgi:hypothetical protein
MSPSQMLELGKKVLQLRGRKAEQIGGKCRLYEDHIVYLWGSIDKLGRYFDVQIMACIGDVHDPVLRMKGKNISEFVPREDIFLHMQSLILLDLMAE